MLLDRDLRGYSWINESNMSAESHYMNLNILVLVLIVYVDQTSIPSIS